MENKESNNLSESTNIVCENQPFNETGEALNETPGNEVRSDSVIVLNETYVSENNGNSPNTSDLPVENMRPQNANFYCNNYQRYEVNNTTIQGPVGLGGWLVLVAIGRILSPLLLLVTVVQTYVPYITGDILETLSDPSSEAYSSLWKPTIFFELFCNVILFALGIFILYLFFAKKRLFPKAFIGLAILTVAISIIDAVLLMLIQNSISIDIGMNPIPDIIKPIISSAIWIPYMLVSQRVKNTFVN